MKTIEQNLVSFNVIYVFRDVFQTFSRPAGQVTFMLKCNNSTQKMQFKSLLLKCILQFYGLNCNMDWHEDIHFF